MLSWDEIVRLPPAADRAPAQTSVQIICSDPQTLAPWSPRGLLHASSLTSLLCGRMGCSLPEPPVVHLAQDEGCLVRLRVLCLGLGLHPLLCL